MVAKGPGRKNFGSAGAPHGRGGRALRGERRSTPGPRAHRAGSPALRAESPGRARSARPCMACMHWAGANGQGLIGMPTHPPPPGKQINKFQPDKSLTRANLPSRLSFACPLSASATFLTSPSTIALRLCDCPRFNGLVQLSVGSRLSRQSNRDPTVARGKDNSL